MGASDFFRLLSEASMLGVRCTMGNALDAFVQSARTIVEGLGWHEWDWTINEAAFFEAIARCVAHTLQRGIDAPDLPPCPPPMCWQHGLRPYIGLELARAAVPLRGLLVLRVTAGGPAATARIQKGQYLWSVGGCVVATEAMFKAMLHACAVGDTVEVEVRNGHDEHGLAMVEVGALHKTPQELEHRRMAALAVECERSEWQRNWELARPMNALELNTFLTVTVLPALNNEVRSMWSPPPTSAQLSQPSRPRCIRPRSESPIALNGAGQACEGSQTAFSSPLPFTAVGHSMDRTSLTTSAALYHFIIFHHALTDVRTHARTPRITFGIRVIGPRRFSARVRFVQTCRLLARTHSKTFCCIVLKNCSPSIR